MRKFLAVLLVAGPALMGAQARAADIPECCDIEVPEVDYGLEGSFYLRGSAGLNLLWTREHVLTDGTTNTPTEAGYGYSVGAGFGYETGTGLRFDGTLDYLYNIGLTDGTDTLELRSTIALANVYYDFPLGDIKSADGGFGAYVGAGLGGAYYTTHITPADPVNLPDGSGFTPAAAATVGVSYDMGNWVGDLGYRFIYMPTITNGQAAVSPITPWYINDNTVHELQATVRYRLQ